MSNVTPARRLAGAITALFTPIFALPLLLDPYRWARAFGWKKEPVTDVALYVGRCLGALAAVHSRGPLDWRQPPIEHAEIAGYSLVALAARRFKPE